MLVGSNVFFKDIDGFNSKDVDILELIDNPIGFKNNRWIKFPHKDVFQWRRMPIKEFIKITLSNNIPLEIGKFLVPEFIKEFNLSINDLKKLQPLIENLDDKHKYESVIYYSYLQNNDFYLTDEQLMEAYKIYIKYRE